MRGFSHTYTTSWQLEHLNIFTPCPVAVLRIAFLPHLKHLAILVAFLC